MPRQWKSDFCGCFCYRTPEGSCTCFPYFIPMSVCGTCCIIGRIVTKINYESPICCEMGPLGWCTCFFSNVAMGPPGFLVAGCCLRNHIVKKYDVQSSLPEPLPACCFPCSYYQMFMSLREWHAEAEAESGSAKANPVDNPITYEPSRVKK